MGRSPLWDNEDFLADCRSSMEKKAIMAKWEVSSGLVVDVRKAQRGDLERRMVSLDGEVPAWPTIQPADPMEVHYLQPEARPARGGLSLSLKCADPQIGFACPRSNNASISSLPHFVGGVLPTPQQARDNWAQISRTMPTLPARITSSFSSS